MKKVKDKRISPGTVLFVAVVEYFQDTPSRDADIPVEEVFETLVLAQKFLSTFPRDVWDGYCSTSFKYVEKDENVRKRNKRKATVNYTNACLKQTGTPNLGQSFGRTFARLD